MKALPLTRSLPKPLIALLMKVALVTHSGVDVTRSALVHWGGLWKANHQTLVTLTLVNTGITAGMEFLSRTILSSQNPAAAEASKITFFVTADHGTTTVNRQSLINIFMTLFASLIGGPIYFLIRPRNRYLFFISIGLSSTVLGHFSSAYVREGLIGIFWGRFLFDIIYMASLKFMVFEWFRKPILRVQSQARKVLALRISQDFFMTLLRVILLNYFGFHG